MSVTLFRSAALAFKRSTAFASLERIKISSAERLLTMTTTSSTLTCAPSSTLESNTTYLSLPLASSSSSPPPFSSLSSPSSLQSPSPSTSSPPSSTSLSKPSQALPIPSTSPDNTSSKKRSAASAFGLDGLDVGLDGAFDTLEWEDDDYDQPPFHQRLSPFSPFRPFAASRVPRYYSVMRNLRGGVYDCDDDDQSALGLYAPYDSTTYAPLGQTQQTQPQAPGQGDPYQLGQHGVPIQQGQQQPPTPQLSTSHDGYVQQGQSLEQMEPVQQSLVSSGVGDEEGVALLSAAAAGLVPLPTTSFRQSTLSPQSPSLHTPSMVNFDMQLAPLVPSPIQTPPLTPFNAVPFMSAPSGAMLPPPPPAEETGDLLTLIRPAPMPHLPMPRGFCLSTIQDGDVPKLVQLVSSIPRPAGRKLIAKLLANSAPSFPSSAVSSYPSSAASLASLPSSNSSFSPSPFPETDEQALRASIQARVGQQTALPGHGQPGWRYNVIRRSNNFNDIVGLILLEPVERETLRTWIPGAEAEENTWMFGAVVDPTYMGMGVATVSVCPVSLELSSFRIPAASAVPFASLKPVYPGSNRRARSG